ncbi:MAG: thiolase family protein, partial [Vicinamibacterales bacterium]
MPSSSIRDAFLVDGVRTAIGAFGGSLAHSRPDDLAAHVMQRLLDRYPTFDREQIADVILGCANQAGEDNRNVARMSLLLAGLPMSIPGQTVNRLCASGLTAVASAAAGVRLADGDVYLAGGVESMTRVPIVSDQGPMSPVLMERYEIIPQIESADRIATKWNFSRERLDTFALESQRRAVKAIDDGVFKKEIVNVPLDANGHVAWTGAAAKEVSVDEHPRRDTTLEKLASLNPALGTKAITAGNSSGINDAACAVLVASRDAAKKHGWKPRARVTHWVSVGSDPTLMLTGPMPATKMVLKEAGLTVGDIDLFEINEAFASVPLAWMHDLDVDHARVNVNGGAIALGHPL